MNGLIVQWGTTNSRDVSLPINFTSATSYTVTLTLFSDGDNQPNDECVLTRKKYNSHFTWADTYSRNGSWIAIGY